MTEGVTPHHLPITAEQVRGNDGRGRVFFLPGSDGRAQKLSEHFRDRQVVAHERQHNVYLGRIERDGRSVDAAAVSTGMGCPSLSIIVTELIELGARLLVRVGTSGSVAPDVVRAGSLVIATACVRDEGASDRYVSRDYPAVGHPDWVNALRRAALRLGRGDRTFMGVVHAKDALYAVEFGHGPLGQRNHEYMQHLRQMRVLASDMETSHLFVLSDVHSRGIAPLSQGAVTTDVVRSGSLLAVVGDDSPYAQPEVARQAEEDAIGVAIEAALDLLAGGGAP